MSGRSQMARRETEEAKKVGEESEEDGRRASKTREMGKGRKESNSRASETIPLSAASACITQRGKILPIGQKALECIPIDFYLRLSQFLSFSHQVLVPTAGIRGFLDASDYGTWLKYIREAKTDDDVISGKSNVRHFLLAGQIYYETTRDIDAGEELLLGPKASEPSTLLHWRVLRQSSVSTR